MSALAFLLPLTLLMLDASFASAESPTGWFLAGNDPKSYAIDVDKSVGHEGKSSGRLMSTRPSSGFGTMMQSFDPGEYRGKRVRLSAWVKASKVSGWAGLWMRVDGPDRKMLSFDNMANRSIKGTKDWSKYEVVLDVPEEAVGISFGILVDGQGTVWIDEIAFAVVDASTPVTGNQSQNRKPANLNFE